MLYLMNWRGSTIILGHPPDTSYFMNTNSSLLTQRWLAILMFIICAWGIADISFDSPQERQPVHLTFEIALLLCSMSAGIWLWRSWRRSEKNLLAVRYSLEQSHQTQEEWRQRASLFIDGFHHALAEQFSDWQLTPAECEVAQFLLRGFSHKDIARFSGRSERTARQHSVAVYKKAKLAGRAELSAFFLEGLLPAPTQTESARRD